MEYTNKKILDISLPILFALIIQQLIGLTDTAFLGRLGAVELGASALAGVFYIMIFMLAQGFGVGVQIIVARRNGETNTQKIGRVVYQGVFCLLAAAVIVLILLYANAQYLLKMMISSDDVYEKSLEYFDIRIFGFLFAFPLVVFRAFFIGITKTKILTWNAIFMLLINVILDYIFIFGKLGSPVMGIAGAALASVIAEALAAIFFVWYIRYKVEIQKYGFDKFVLFNKKIVGQIWSLSVWTMLQYFVSMATWFLFLLAIEKLGENELAISNILRSVSSIPYMVVAAFSAAANTITSNLIGAAKNEQVLHTSKQIMKMAYFSVGVLAIIMALFPKLMIGIYTNEEHLIIGSIWPYYAALISFATMVPGLILLSVVSGTGQTQKAMYMEFVALLVYMLNVWYVVLYLKADLFVCWTTDYSYNIVLLLLTYIYLKRNNWCCKII